MLGKHYLKPKNEWMRDQLAPLKWYEVYDIKFVFLISRETDMEWFESRLKAIRQDYANEWIIVFGHHPIFNHTGMNFFSIVVNFKFSLLMFRLCRA
jgi:hypothetical protein